MGDRCHQGIKRFAGSPRKNLLGGGPEHIERQHRRGKLTARERIEILLDPGTFSELAPRSTPPGPRSSIGVSRRPATGPWSGPVWVEGRRIAVYASDFTVLGGSIGTQHGLKFVKLLEMAARSGESPWSGSWTPRGDDLGYRDVPMAGIDWWFALEARYSGLIPQINVLMGPCIAGQAYCPALCDFLLISRTTPLFSWADPA